MIKTAELMPVIKNVNALKIFFKVYFERFFFCDIEVFPVLLEKKNGIIGKMK